MGKTRSFPVEEMEPGTATDGDLSGATGSEPAAAPSVRAASGDAPQPSRTIWCFDLRRYGTVESLVAELDAIALESTGTSFSTVEATALAAAERLLAIEEEAKQRWYPVVDYRRCGNCLECLNFCLFGVFGLSDGRLVVEEPDACRPGCPACARVCPSQAIMFPQHADPFFAGDPTASPQPPDAESLKQLGLTFVTPAMLQPGTMASAERARALLEKAAGAGAESESPSGSTAATAEAASKGSSAKPSDSTDRATGQHRPAGDASKKLSRLVDDLEQSDL
jgi:NAD-dependent dihydropyrimidine dehydrogenase PreA subunit